MNVLVLGSGGREHTLAWKIAQSTHCTKLFIAPGNAGTLEVGINVELNPENFEAVKVFCVDNNIDMVVVGPEAPLVSGIIDFFLADESLKKIRIIGPDKAAAMLEGSKEFAKEFMIKYNIPTARYFSATMDNLQEAEAFLDKQNPPFVLKADGLAAGKGVLIIEDRDEAKASLKEMLEGKFGEASKTVVIEQFLKGIELSVFALTDGESYVLLPEAKDYKRIGERDTGLNTGGMGSVSPVPFASKEFLNKIETKIVRPTIQGINAEHMNYKGFLFFGLIKVGDEPYVIEYNVRMGDPETESVIPRIKTDLLELLNATSQSRLSETDIRIDDRFAATIMLVSGGYPESYEKGKIITGTEETDNSIIFHAGTKREGKNVLTSGGRVLAICSLADSMEKALEISKSKAEKISFEGKYYRRDIGFDL